MSLVIHTDSHAETQIIIFSSLKAAATGEVRFRPAPPQIIHKMEILVL